MGGFLFISVAYKHANASTISPIMNLDCIFNIFTDLFYFGYEFYYSDLAGGLLTIGCVVFPVIILIIAQKKRYGQFE